MSPEQAQHNSILQADRLRVRFDLLGSLVLKNVTFAVQPGEVVCVVGPNGAGKTTLLNILSGSLMKTGCKVRVFGHNRWRKNALIRRQTTYVPAYLNYSVGNTPYEHFLAVGLAYGMEKEVFAARWQELANDLNYQPYVHRDWATLSLGLSHKAMIIGGFLPPAKLRILDEPVASGIDTLGMEIIGVWIKEARARGESIIFSTQVLDRAHMLADKLLILSRGALIFWGPPSELIERYGFDPRDEYALNRAFFELFKKDKE